MINYNYVYNKKDDRFYSINTDTFISEGDIYNKYAHKNMIAQKLYENDVKAYLENVAAINLLDPELDKSSLVYFNGKEQILDIRIQKEDITNAVSDIKFTYEYIELDLSKRYKKDSFVLRCLTGIEVMILVSIVMLAFSNTLLTVFLGGLAIIVLPIVILDVISSKTITGNKLMKIKELRASINTKKLEEDYLNGRKYNIKSALKSLNDLGKQQVAQVEQSSIKKI